MLRTKQAPTQACALATRLTIKYVWLRKSGGLKPTCTPYTHALPTATLLWICIAEPHNSTHGTLTPLMRKTIRFDVLLGSMLVLVRRQ